MGFSLNAARKATYLTKNGGVEAAAEWIMQHLDDADINDEHPDLTPHSTKKTDDTFDLDVVSNLVAFGFSEYQAKHGLKMSRGDLNAAADWLVG